MPSAVPSAEHWKTLNSTYGDETFHQLSRGPSREDNAALEDSAMMRTMVAVEGICRSHSEAFVGARGL